MNKPEQPKNNSTTAQPETQLVNQGRRKLSKAALATPVIATLAARPALACSVSGFLSGNASPGRDDPRCDGFGCTPGFWKNNVKAWPAPYSPGSCKTWQGPHCKEWNPGVPGTLLSAILPPACAGVGTFFTQVSASDSMMSIFLKAVDSGGKVTTEYADVCHYMAAILNAKASEASYGSSVADIQAGLCKAAQEGKINYYTTVLLAGLNERGCMFDAWGNCEKNFTSVDGICIPACPTGTAWDSQSMTCKSTTP